MLIPAHQSTQIYKIFI